MAHVSWYRKYRPQTFADVVGQSHIEQTLSNAVSEHAVAHLYLFTGPRGTGKTTTARILAKALNCEQGPTATPDDTCDQCRMITDGVHPDVQELDAASRRGIDDVREQIIGRVGYAPSRGSWKVYIIDEVHMLTREAFNALLKTFEEPPPHTVFVLCTTDPQKVPETIHSRCQRFDFHRISVEDIVERLRLIADAEGVTVPDGALVLIAKHARGGLRDAIGTLEQLSSFGGGTIAIEDVEGLLGEVDAELLFQAVELIIERDVTEAFRLVARLAEQGVDMSEFVKGLVRQARDIFVLAAAGADGAVDTTAADLGRLQSQASRLGTDRTARLLEVLGRLTTELRYAADQRLAVEVALTRMARPQADLTIEAIAERLDALEAGAPVRERAPVAAQPQATVAAPSAPQAGGASKSHGGRGARAARETGATAPGDGGAPDTAPVRGDGQVATVIDVVSVKRAWPAVLAEFKKARPSRSHLFNGTEVELVDGALVVEFPSDQGMLMKMAADAETMALLRQCVAAVLDADLLITYRLGRAGRSTERAVPDAPAGEAPSGDEGISADESVAPVGPVPSEDEGVGVVPEPGTPSTPDAPVAPAAPDAPPTPGAPLEHDDLEAQVIAELGASPVGDVTPEA